MCSWKCGVRVWCECIKEEGKLGCGIAKERTEGKRKGRRKEVERLDEEGERQTERR